VAILQCYKVNESHGNVPDEVVARPDACNAGSSLPGRGTRLRAIPGFSAYYPQLMTSRGR